MLRRPFEAKAARRLGILAAFFGALCSLFLNIRPHYGAVADSHAPSRIRSPPSLAEHDVLNALKRRKSSKTGEFGIFYPKLLAPLLLKSRHQGDLIVFLEIGNRRGETLQALLDLFPNGILYGLDLGKGDYKKLDIPSRFAAFKNVHLFQGDQADTSLLEKIGENAMKRQGGFDVIIDDGGHRMFQQKASLYTLWKFLKPGGRYVIEDTETSYYEHYGGTSDLNTNTTFVSALKSLVDVLNRDYIGYDPMKPEARPRRGAGTYSVFPGDDSIYSVQFITNAAVLSKSNDSL